MYGQMHYTRRAMRCGVAIQGQENTVHPGTATNPRWRPNAHQERFADENKDGTLVMVDDEKYEEEE